MQHAKKTAKSYVKPPNQAQSTIGASNAVRINAGMWRSRMLKFPNVEGLRPTPERVRQTVFNWLGQDLTGYVCLDLFAGTGAFGFEALSRNAKQVVMVELSKAAYQALLNNQAMLDARHGTVLHQSAEQFLLTNVVKFDVIFCDPPFHQGWVTRLLPLLQQHLSEQGVLYVEAEFALERLDGWQVIKHNKAGNVYYHLLKSVK